MGIREDDTSGWKIHAKDVPTIDIDALSRLAASTPLREEWSHVRGWLDDDKRYRVVPDKGATNAPRPRMRNEWLERLAELKIIAEVPKAEVRGHVTMFAVPERTKERFRPIKHTRDVNEALGKDSLRPCRFPSKHEICELVNKGSHFIALDFAAYFDQFPYSTDISRRFCFPWKKRWWRLMRLAMGQRQAVEVANTATGVLLAFDKRSHSEQVIDNVIFVGTKEAVIADATILLARVKQVNALLNDIPPSVEELVQTSGDWCGIHLDLDAKTVCLTDKILEKLRVSWSRRSSWTWRNFAAHVGLLFWSWGILDVPVAEYFPLLRFLSHAGVLLFEDEGLWDTPADIWPSVWHQLDAWTVLAQANRARAVPPRQRTEWLLMTDASRWGWGYVAYNLLSGESCYHSEQWSAHMRNVHGLRLARSTFAEPHAVYFAACHLLKAGPPTSVRVATDNIAAKASFERGFNSHSPHINDCVARLRRTFGERVQFSFEFVPGKSNLADPYSRGLVAPGGGAKNFAGLRQVMGD